MIDLNKEAEEFLKSRAVSFSNGKDDELYDRVSSNDLILFADTSKYVQAKIIQAQIDSLTMVLNCYNLLHEDVNDLHLTLDRLKQQLKQLGNE
jgi:hypothetical protein